MKKIKCEFNLFNFYLLFCMNFLMISVSFKMRSIENLFCFGNTRLLRVYLMIFLFSMDVAYFQQEKIMSIESS